MEVMLRKSHVLEIKNTQTNKTFRLQNITSIRILVSFGAISLEWSSSVSPFNFIKQKAWFEMFSRFIRNQTCIFSLFLHISLAIHRNFRNRHQIFCNRSGSYKIHALPIFIFLVYRFHGNIDHLKNTFSKTSIFFQKLV